jgi:3'-phosphoadenosine 5'-phosphosulfate sulfotransferase (PAPS reductase)/FAD synthetase
VEEATTPIQEIKGSPDQAQGDSLITTMRKQWEQDKVSHGCHQPKKSKPINKAKRENKTKIKNTPAKASRSSSPPKKTKKVWRVKSIIRIFHSGTGRAQD